MIENDAHVSYAVHFEEIESEWSNGTAIFVLPLKNPYTTAGYPPLRDCKNKQR